MTSFARRLYAIQRTFTSFTYPRDLPLMIGAFRNRRYEPCPANIWQIIDPFGGYLRSREAGLLYRTAARWPLTGPVVELGSYEGRSTIVFASAGRFVHAVDAWSLTVQDRSAYKDDLISADDVFDRFKRNLHCAGVEDRVHVHRGLTKTIGQEWNMPCAILMVDAGHTYEDAKSDLKTWTPFLLPGGLLLMHDVICDGFPGVKRAASELLGKGWRVVASADSLVAFAQR
ncbi:MAG TPA: class I SAM-dependent methyltransferase [Anaerolineae bacterium]|nr:class I SAM-dependent methyltransferase [Anaerolineae bacterium]